MKTTLDIVDIVYGYLAPTVFANTLSGKVYKHKRPINSKLEDVVISCLPTVNVDLQTAIVNVNVHVPDLIIAANGSQESQPNHLRLDALGTAIQPLLDQSALDYNFNIQQQIMVEDFEAKQHYLNFRLEFFSINVLN